MRELEHSYQTLPGLHLKTPGIADVVCELNQAHDGSPAFYQIPDSPEAVAQLLLLFEMSGLTNSTAGGIKLYSGILGSRSAIIRLLLSQIRDIKGWGKVLPNLPGLRQRRVPHRGCPSLDRHP